mmetsp:Transcript_33636/g.38312  ORF Transcript_33636/g.38312 Transcript_33636/m.38312 type:complete len:637 (+) Transcript_33636:46-1956(+)
MIYHKMQLQLISLSLLLCLCLLLLISLTTVQAFTTTTTPISSFTNTKSTTTTTISQQRTSSYSNQIGRQIKDNRQRFSALSSSSSNNNNEDDEYDVVVIGSGLGGLSCGSMLATAGKKVLVLESHYELGGCAHEYMVDLKGRTIPSSSLTEKDDVFRFEVGPSLYSGLSPDNSPNPLKHVFQMIEEEPEWITYDKWGAYLPEAPEGYELSIGAENFLKILDRYGGPTARQDWEDLASDLRPLAKKIMGLPSSVVRNDIGLVATLALRYPIPFLRVIGDVKRITAPFDLDEYKIQDKFLRNYLDLIAFLLQGLPANQTLTAVMAYMVEDFYREGAVMDFPKGGSKGIIDALARGVTKHDGCHIRKNSLVDEVIVENDRAVGIRLSNNKIIRAREGVVSNTDLKQTYDLVKTKHDGLEQEKKLYISDKQVPLCKSFMHLHLGVKAELIPEDAPAQWTVVQDWDKAIDAPGNVVVVSVPSKLDPSLAPKGYHVIHAYGAGNEPYEPWERFEHLKTTKERAENEEYQQFKSQRSQPIWDAIARRAPLVKTGSVEVEQVGTPLTHSRFLRRHRGNYGLAIPAGSEEYTFPSVETPLKGYYRCGDSTTSGIGVPAVASSGAQCANALLTVWEQLKLNSKIRM